jgi:hypothetical protein
MVLIRALIFAVIEKTITNFLGITIVAAIDSTGALRNT